VRGLRSGVPPTEVPWDLTQNVRHRVAALPVAARAVLDVAAVAGRQVDAALLLAVAGQQEEEVLAALEAACGAHVLEAAGAHGYRFGHDVIREVVEADLGAARRTVLHRRIAAALEAERGVHPADVLAYHYARGSVPDKAVHYLEVAGDQARTQYAHAAAAGAYRELVELLERLGRTREAAAVREKLGVVLNTVAQYDAALAVLEPAASAYQGMGEREGLWRVLAAIGHVHENRATPEEGVQRLQAVLGGLDTGETSPGLAVLHVALASLLFLRGRYSEQLAAAERAATLARAAGDEQTVAAAEHLRGLALLEHGRYGEALPVLEEASRVAAACSDLRTLCRALNLEGCVYEDRGEFAHARQYTERALAVAQRHGDPTLIAYLTTRRGTSAFRTGDWAQARVDYEQALAWCRQIGASNRHPYPLLDLGRLCLAEGAWEEGARYLEESRAMSVRSGDLLTLRWAQLELAEHDLAVGCPEVARARLEPLLDRPGLEEKTVTFLLAPLAQAHLELGEVERAAALVGQGVQRARAQSNRRALVSALRVQALVLTRQACWSAAERAVEQGLVLARGMPYPYGEACLLHVYGMLRIQQGELGPARGRLRAALAIFHRLGARKDRERTEQAIAQLGPSSVVAP
jgi:tetratricopeptide (TPR) repeat protein